MAGNNIRINTSEVARIANELEQLNSRLVDELQQCKQDVDNLANIWQGEAADTTIHAFDSFSLKYFRDYEETIEQYVKFLRSNVEIGYERTETENSKLAQAFK